MALLVMALLFVTLGLRPEFAAAVTCTVLGSGKGKVADPSVSNQWGGRSSGISVVDPPSSCPLVRSLYINGIDSDNWVEIGWYKDGTDASVSKCDDTTDPHILVWASVNGFRKCKPNPPALSAGETYSFRVDNPDHDNDFVYYWSSDSSPTILLGHYTTDHTSGRPQAATERHYDGENLRVDMSGIKSLRWSGDWDPFPDWYDFSTPGTGDYRICDTGPSLLEVRSTC